MKATSTVQAGGDILSSSRPTPREICSLPHFCLNRLHTQWHRPQPSNSPPSLTLPSNPCLRLASVPAPLSRKQILSRAGGGAHTRGGPTRLLFLPCIIQRTEETEPPSPAGRIDAGERQWWAPTAARRAGQSVRSKAATAASHRRSLSCQAVGWLRPTRSGPAAPAQRTSTHTYTVIHTRVCVTHTHTHVCELCVCVYHFSLQIIFLLREQLPAYHQE